MDKYLSIWRLLCLLVLKYILLHTGSMVLYMKPYQVSNLASLDIRTVHSAPDWLIENLGALNQKINKIVEATVVVTATIIIILRFDIPFQPYSPTTTELS